MTTLLSDTDPRQQTATHGPIPCTMEQCQCEVRCGMCGKIIYVDEETIRFVSDAIKAGLDGPFQCEICKEEYDDLVYDG